MTDAASPTALDIARDLLRFRSITPVDGGALPYLAKLLAEAGFATQIERFSAPGTPDIDNLWARYGTAAPCLAFAGHTDVVPPGDESRWRFGPFAGEVADGRLWGRGAADMKGGVAASVAAALRVIAAGECKGSIAFLITGDEEGPAVNGTVKLVDWAHARGERIDHCVLGEPTSVATLGDTIKNGRRGSLTGRLRLIGKQGHVAYPHLADNPIRALPKVIDALLGEPLDAGTADFDPTHPRNRQRRCRQPRDQRNSRRGSRRLQHPLQRSLVAGLARRRNPPPTGDDGRATRTDLRSRRMPCPS